MDEHRGTLCAENVQWFPHFWILFSLEQTQLATLFSSLVSQQVNHTIAAGAFSLPAILLSTWPGGPTLIHRAFTQRKTSAHQSLFHSGSSTFEDNANHGYNFSNMHQLLAMWKYFREDMTQSQPLLRTSQSTRQWQSCDLRTSCANSEAKSFVRFGLLDSLKTLCRRHSGFGRAYVPAY